MYSTFRLMEPLEESRSTVWVNTSLIFLLHPVTKTVVGNEIRLLVSAQSNIINVTIKELFYFPAGVDVVHVGIQNNLEHHLRMIRATTAFLI